MTIHWSTKRIIRRWGPRWLRVLTDRWDGPEVGTLKSDLATILSRRVTNRTMKLIGLQEALKSADLDIKMVAGRASPFRVFGSAHRIADDKLLIADLRDSSEPADLAEHYQVLDRHPMAAILLVRRI